MGLIMFIYESYTHSFIHTNMPYESKPNEEKKKIPNILLLLLLNAYILNMKPKKKQGALFVRRLSSKNEIKKSIIHM